jgi:hypothetical protein
LHRVYRELRQPGMGRSDATGLSLRVVSTTARRAARRDLLSTPSRISSRESLSTVPRGACPERSRGERLRSRSGEYLRTVGSPANASQHQRRCVARLRCQQNTVTSPGDVAQADPPGSRRPAGRHDRQPMAQDRGRSRHRRAAQRQWTRAGRPHGDKWPAPSACSRLAT